MTEQPKKKRNYDPNIVNMIGEDTLDVVNVLIFVNHPEDKDAQQKKGGKFEGFNYT
jgi:hypothetical protein